ncbi:hypothetical protein [Devosia submarina]|uniref:hypothetical protein n=1 Tax=Devosia submarina TaxID=1173082 RepID=UPI001300943E|nr:hypothetical protein [Devosia submarina]
MPPKRYAVPPPPDFESIEDAADHAAIIINALRRLASTEANSLADKLFACVDYQPCGSEACPVCVRSFRKRLHSGGVKAAPIGAGFLAMSLIPATCRVEVGQLSAVDLKTWVTSRQRAIARALPAEAMFFGGVDISLNTFNNADPHWCKHLYGYVILPPAFDIFKRSVRDGIRSALKRHCPLHNGASRSLLLSARDRATFNAKLLYAYKARFYRRSQYGEVKWKTGKRSTNVDGQSLRSAEVAELALFLDRFPLGSRLILKGLRRRGLRGGTGQFTLVREVNW